MDDGGAADRTLKRLFVVGPSRCGTTLLGFLLGGHPAAMSLSEPFYARSIYGPSRHKLHARLLAGKQRLRHVNPGKAQDWPSLQDYLDRFALANGKNILIVKETYRQGREWDNVGLLSWIAGDRHPVVGITRNPYDAAVSTLRMYRLWRGALGHAARLWVKGLPLFSGDQDIMHYFAQTWVGFLHWSKAHGVEVVRYEDLVRSTESTLRAICQRTNLDFHPAMADSKAPRAAFGGIGAPEVMMHRKRSAVHSRSLGRKKELAPHLREIVRTACAPDASALGYEL